MNLLIRNTPGEKREDLDWCVGRTTRKELGVNYGRGLNTAIWECLGQREVPSASFIRSIDIWKHGAFRMLEGHTGRTLLEWRHKH